MSTRLTARTELLANVSRSDPRSVSEAVRTTCPYCGVGCGVLARPHALPDSARGAAGPAATPGCAAHPGVAIGGDPDHPANLGRLCSKGAALGETLDWQGRLLTPRVLGHDVAWPEALQYVATGFNRIIEADGPDAVAFYVSGQLLTEDYYVANKLMKGYIGSANIDTNSRLCMSSAVAAHKRAFGEDIVPVSYRDLELADLVVLVGSNTAWCHPVVYQRIVKAKEVRPDLTIVVIDPRSTATCDIADLHLPLKTGTDVWLFNGLLSYLHQHGIEDREFVNAHTLGSSAALTVADNTAGSTAAVARLCNLKESALARFYDLFARTERVITLFSQGVNQSSSGTDKASSIINCHLLSGRIGRPGAGPFSITGQPNAMGGREVGGLANTLAAHMDIENEQHRRIVKNFWLSPRIAQRPGLKAVDLFEALYCGKVKAIWIAGTNPAVSLPNADRARLALARCNLVVVSDCVAETDTNAFAHVLLPAAAWGEKDGTVTNSERCISRQRSFLPPAGQAKPDWWIFAQVAKHMGYAEGFDYGSAHEVFLEHAQLSAQGNDGARAFDIGALGKLDAEGYAALTPTRWPIRSTPEGSEASPAGSSPTAAPAPERLFADGRFYHADGKARFIATTPHGPANTLDEEFPLALNTGRIRDQWHTMTRTGKSARLMEHLPEPFVDMHPQDALLSGVRVGELVRVFTRWGSLVARLRCSGEMPRRLIFVPMHWSNVVSSDARVGALVNPVVDPISGEPESKHTPARVSSFVVAWQGFALSRRRLTLKNTTFWSVTQGEHVLRYELAGRRVFSDWAPWARRLLGVPPDDDWLEYVDPATGVFRAAHLKNDQLQSCLFLSPRPDLPPRGWLSSLFAKARLASSDRTRLLMGIPGDPAANIGAVVCSCFNVGRNTICSAIRNHGLRSTAQVGERLRAGTNCGSCLPEIRTLLNKHGESQIRQGLEPSTSAL
jgi:assimilatory nitrate reductase catalytic subunit